MSQEDFKIKNEVIQEKLKSIGDSIQSVLPSGWIFALFIASVGENGSTFYISTGRREEMASLLKEHIEKVEKETPHTFRYSPDELERKMHEYYAAPFDPRDDKQVKGFINWLRAEQKVT